MMSWLLGRLASPAYLPVGDMAASAWRKAVPPWRATSSTALGLQTNYCPSADSGRDRDATPTDSTRREAALDGRINCFIIASVGHLCPGQSWEDTGVSGTDRTF